MADIKGFCIENRRISMVDSPYVIAEVSANHNGKLETALKIIKEAKEAGADAVKLQTYTADTITLKSESEDFKIKTGLWAGRTLHDLYTEAHMPWDWHKPLFEYAHELGITIFSSPFDPTAVDLLEGLDAPAYKIASFEIVDLPLIKRVASTGKPMIISTGMANASEIDEAIDAARMGGCTEIAILHCVSGYPAPASDYNLNTIPDMIARFGLVTGLSDHTLGNTTSLASVALGARIIEKHFTLDRNGGGPDDSFSLEPSELSELCQKIKEVWSALGSINYERKSSELTNLKYRRSLYVVTDVRKGEHVTQSNVRSIRPGYGMPSKYYDEVMGRLFVRDVPAGSALDSEMIK